MNVVTNVVAKVLVVALICIAVGLNYKMILANKKEITFKELVKCVIPIILTAVAVLVY